MLSCLGLLWFLQNPTSHSSRLATTRGRFLVKTMPLQSVRFSLPVRRDVGSSRDDTAIAGTSSLVSLCRCGGKFKCSDHAISEAVDSRTAARAQCPILTCYSLEGEISIEAPQRTPAMAA
jgi:hypothetical protein